MSGNHRYAIDVGVVADVSFVTAPISFKLSHLVAPAGITGVILVLALVWNASSLTDTSEIHTEAKPLSIHLSQAVSQASQPQITPVEPLAQQLESASEAVSAVEPARANVVHQSREVPVPTVDVDAVESALRQEMTPPQRPAREAMVPSFSQPAVPVARPKQDTQSTQAIHEHQTLQLSYQAHIRQRIQKYKYYPKASRRMGEQGTVILAFTIDHQGHLSSSVISQSSGHKRLDTAALRCLKRCGQFSQPPKALLEDGSLAIRLPLHYGLHDGVKAASL